MENQTTSEQIRKPGRPRGVFSGKYTFEGVPISVFEYRKLLRLQKRRESGRLSVNSEKTLKALCQVLSKSQSEVIDLALETFRRQILSSTALTWGSKAYHGHDNIPSIPYISGSTEPAQIKESRKSSDLSVPESST